MTYAGFVDANCLLYLWPSEFDSCRICIISGNLNRPIFSCFLSNVRIPLFRKNCPYSISIPIAITISFKIFTLTSILFSTFIFIFILFLSQYLPLLLWIGLLLIVLMFHQLAVFFLFIRTSIVIFNLPYDLMRSHGILWHFPSLLSSHFIFPFTFLYWLMYFTYIPSILYLPLGRHRSVWRSAEFTWRHHLL